MISNLVEYTNSRGKLSISNTYAWMNVTCRFSNKCCWLYKPVYVWTLFSLLPAFTIAKPLSFLSDTTSCTFAQISCLFLISPFSPFYHQTPFRFPTSLKLWWNIPLKTASDSKAKDKIKPFPWCNILPSLKTTATFCHSVHFWLASASITVSKSSWNKWTSV